MRRKRFLSQPGELIRVTSAVGTDGSASKPAGAVIYDISSSSATLTWCSGSSCQYPNTTLRFRARSSVTVRFVLEDSVGGTWRQVKTTSVHARRGANQYRIAGRWHGKLVPAGPVRLLVQAKAGARWTTYGTLKLTVIHKHKPS